MELKHLIPIFAAAATANATYNGTDYGRDHILNAVTSVSMIAIISLTISSPFKLHSCIDYPLRKTDWIMLWRCPPIGGSRGEQGDTPPPSQENHKLLLVSLEIRPRTPDEMQLDPLGPTASRGRPILPSVKYVDD